MSSVKDEALRLLAAGLSVVPIRADGSKAPDISWKPYQENPPTPDAVKRWFRNDRTVGMALVCGAVSGHLECLDFDDLGAFAAWCQATDPALRDRLAMAQTPGPGMQVWYRCPAATIPGNQKLARRATATGWEVLIETRGEGGYAIIPPSPAACHPSGRPYTMAQGDFGALPELLADERTALIEAARGLNEYEEAPKPLKPVESARSAPDGELTPMEDYNARGSWTELLMKHDWEIESWRGDVSYWKRPGKGEEGHSASLGHVAPGILYVFSSNASPFEGEKTYDLFGAKARLEYGGDFKECARALRAEGFGAVQETVTVKGPKRSVSSSGDGETQTEEETKTVGSKPGKKDAAKIKDDLIAQIWATQERDRFLFIDGGQWWRWNETNWRYCSPDIAETEMHRFLRELVATYPDIDINPTRVKALLSLARVDLGPVLPDDMNPRKDWIPLSNGVYDVGTDELRPHSPAHRNTYCLTFPHAAEAGCPRWTQFLTETLIDSEGKACREWIGAVQEWFGYCLIADHNRAQSAMFWIGEGGNGKGVATRVLEKLVGAGQHMAVSVEQLDEPYHRAALVGKLVGLVNEPSRRAMEKNGETVKMITGGDEIQARNPSERVFSFRPTIRLLVSCNELPSTKDLSHGYFRRVVMIQWRYNVPDEKKDTGLDAKLEAELPGIFNWAVEGLKRFQARGYQFDVLPESVKLKADYRKSQDVVEQFVDDACQIDPEALIGTTELYAAFRAWSYDGGIKEVMDKRRFGMRVASILKARKAGGGSRPKRESEGMSREWVGLKLQDEQCEVEVRRPARCF